MLRHPLTAFLISIVILYELSAASKLVHVKNDTISELYSTTQNVKQRMLYLKSNILF